MSDKCKRYGSVAEMRKDIMQEVIAEQENEIAGMKESEESTKSLIRQIDEIINGKEGMAKQASLCDLIGQIKQLVEVRDENDTLKAMLRDLAPYVDVDIEDCVKSWKQVLWELSESKKLSDELAKLLEIAHCDCDFTHQIVDYICPRCRALAKYKEHKEMEKNESK